MPRPRPDEEKKEFVARCISEIVRKEGLKTDEAVRKCFKIWKSDEEEKDASNPSKEK